MADFKLFLIKFQTKKSTHLQNDFFQKAVNIHSKFLGKKLSFDTNIDFLNSNYMGIFFTLGKFEDNCEQPHHFCLFFAFSAKPKKLNEAKKTPRGATSFPKPRHSGVQF